MVDKPSRLSSRDPNRKLRSNPEIGQWIEITSQYRESSSQWQNVFIQRTYYDLNTDFLGEKKQLDHMNWLMSIWKQYYLYLKRYMEPRFVIGDLYGQNTSPKRNWNVKFIPIEQWEVIVARNCTRFLETNSKFIYDKLGESWCLQSRARAYLVMFCQPLSIEWR